MSTSRIVIVGGGTAGITVAAQLLQQRPGLSVTIVEPSDTHYYQPLWTLVGGGVFPREESERQERDFIPAGATWVQDKVSGFDPEKNVVQTAGGQALEYDYLVVCPGLQLNWTETKGLSQDIVGQHGICCNYHYDTVETTWREIQNFKGGVALFTQPATPIKCGGAPQKICYLAEDYFRKHGVREKAKVIFALAGPRVFAVDPYASSLEEMTLRRGIEVKTKHELIEIRPESREAIFQIVDTDNTITIKYDMLHVTPRMGPLDVIKNSPLAGEGGWVDVDKHTTQHTQFANVFSLGDSSNLPTSKTGAAIRKQAPTTVGNVLDLIDGKQPSHQYDGYTSCPLVTSYNSMILAEFDYDKNPAESFPFDQSKERFSMYLLKKYGLPNLYWHGMLRGRA